MSRKSKIDALKKVKIVEQYLNGEISQKGAARVLSESRRVGEKRQIMTD